MQAALGLSASLALGAGGAGGGLARNKRRETIPGGKWLQVSPSNGSPNGLECLTLLDRLICQNVTLLLRPFSTVEPNGAKYVLKSISGQQVYYAFKDQSSISQTLAGLREGFNLHIMNMFGQEVLNIMQPYHCHFLCGRSSNSNIYVKVPQKADDVHEYDIIASLELVRSGCVFDLRLLDANGRPKLFIEGMAPACKCFYEGNFEIKTFGRNETKVGLITKLTSSDSISNYDISFPSDLDVHLKAAAIAAMFYLNFQNQTND